MPSDAGRRSGRGALETSRPRRWPGSCSSRRPVRINVAAACALILPSACAVLVGCQGWIAIGYFKGGVPDELQTLPFERVLPYVDRTVFAVAALALGVKCLGYVRRAVRSLHAGRVSSADVLRRLALEVSGQATKTVFSGRIRDRETRVEAVEHRLLPGRYRIE